MGQTDRQKPHSITLAGSELIRSWFEPDSVMEFGFKQTRDAFRHMASLLLITVRTNPCH